MKKDEFDIVVLVGPDESEYIHNQIKCTKRNIEGYRNIYLLSYDPSIKIDGCITISEDIFPFSKDTVAKYHGKIKRNGWYLQQLLKLYAGLYIPGILEKYLVLDSDIYFINKVKFIDNGRSKFDFSTVQKHEPYFEHMLNLHPLLIMYDTGKSGVCHHMLFDTKKLKVLFNLVETYHNNFKKYVLNDDNNEQFYEIFLNKVTPENYELSGASEYEIYFNFIQSGLVEQDFDIRKLREAEAQKTEDTNIHNFIQYSNMIGNGDYDGMDNFEYISCHLYNLT